MNPIFGKALHFIESQQELDHSDKPILGALDTLSA